MNYILFTDVSQFHCDGNTNPKNLHSSSYNNPHEVMQRNFQLSVTHGAE